MTAGDLVDIAAAEKRIRRHILVTPLIGWQEGGTWLK